MLRLWRERLLVSLTPDALSWVRLHRAWKPSIYEKRTMQVDPAFGPQRWQGAVAALRAQAESWRADAVDVSIVLSNQFVRYALVPHADSVNGEAEKIALARFHFNKVHGEASQGWDLRLSPAAGKASQLASAIDTALVTALRDCFPAARRARLVSVQPWLMAAFNAARAQIADGGAWLLLVEPERTCAALIGGKSILAVRNVKGRFQEPATWIDLIERERLRIDGIDIERMPKTLLVQSTHPMMPPSHNIGAWKAVAVHTRWPQGTDAYRDGLYSTALTAL